MIDKLSDYLLSIIQSPAKSSITTILGTVTGYLPSTIATLTNEPVFTVDVIFQRLVWTLTSIVAITAIITWVQKQIDRYKKNKLHND